jgi:hypothetical protein
MGACAGLVSSCCVFGVGGAVGSTGCVIAGPMLVSATVVGADDEKR